MLEAIHLGPSIDTIGGTQSVIRTIRDCSIGADRVRVLATWDGPEHVKNARLVGQAAADLIRAPSGTVAHFHISNGGAWLREGALMRVAHATGLRVVVTLHGFDTVDVARAHPHAIRLGLAKADHVICLSAGAADVIRALLPRKGVSVVPNPVELDALAGSAADTLPVALFAGTIGIRKGVDVLVEAWRSLVEAGIDGECRVIGPIDDYCPPDVERLSVRPALHPTDVRPVLREARVVVLPSRAEGMPMILTEALAARRPFVATDVGGTRDITPDQEMIVPVGDIGALARAIARFLRDDVAAGIAGDRGQAYIVETRSPEVVGRRLREIYEGVAG